MNQKEYHRGWRERNREKVNAYAREYYKKFKPINKKYTSKVWFKRISERDGSICSDCGTKKNLTLEHIIPKCIGGKYSYDNLKILCLKCNMRAYRDLVRLSLKEHFGIK